MRAPYMAPYMALYKNMYKQFKDIRAYKKHLKTYMDPVKF